MLLNFKEFLLNNSIWLIAVIIYLKFSLDFYFKFWYIKRENRLKDITAAYIDLLRFKQRRKKERINVESTKRITRI